MVLLLTPQYHTRGKVFFCSYSFELTCVLYLLKEALFFNITLKLEYRNVHFYSKTFNKSSLDSFKHLHYCHHITICSFTESFCAILLIVIVVLDSHFINTVVCTGRDT